ncbi:LysR substrate-binding domain-containing protein [Nitratireductor sp. GISD-1A_MAKvit]|uniref:LysR family transcriptional regulator n=1 Tax=Nitratireductor sp. GISD-1A_MAKvit TaxID=3234198 RepID=UPI003464F395
MNQRQIQAFRLVMRHGSITTAAHALSVSQPAVSRLVAELERSIGFPLLIREGGKITPTAEAIEFEREVDHMYFGLERLSQIAREIKELRRASLYIATMPMVSFEILPRALKGFLSRHEGIRVTHNVHTSARIVDLVSSRQIELGIAQTHVKRPNVDILASYRTYCVCVVTHDHPLADRPTLSPVDLQDEKMVALAHHTLTANYVTRAFAEANIQPDVTVESQPSYAACSLAGRRSWRRHCGLHDRGCVQGCPEGYPLRTENTLRLSSDQTGGGKTLTGGGSFCRAYHRNLEVSGGRPRANSISLQHQHKFSACRSIIFVFDFMPPFPLHRASPVDGAEER